MMRSDNLECSDAARRPAPERPARCSAFYRASRGAWYASIGAERVQARVPAEVASRNTSRDKRAAEGWAAREAERRLSTTGAGPSELTIGELVARFGAAATGAPATRREYASHLRLSVLPVFADKVPGQLTVPVVREWVRGLAAAGLARSTCASRLSTLSVLLGWARAEGLTSAPNNAATPEARRELPKQPRRRVEVLRPEQLAALLADVRVPAVRRIRALCAAYGGLEAGTIAGLRLCDVILDEGREALVIEQAAALVGPGGQHAGIQGPKNDNRRRAVPMHPSLASALRWWVLVGRAELLPARAARSELVFPSARGRPSRPKVAQQLRSDLEDAGVELPAKMTFHRLRSCFATWLRLAGVDDATRAALMGHAGESTAERWYTGEIDAALRAAVNLLPPVDLPEALVPPGGAQGETQEWIQEFSRAQAAGMASRIFPAGNLVDPVRFKDLRLEVAGVPAIACPRSGALARHDDRLEVADVPFITYRRARLRQPGPPDPPERVTERVTPRADPP